MAGVGQAFVSTNGLAWEQALFYAPSFLQTAAFQKGRFLALAANGPEMLSSADGRSWSVRYPDVFIFATSGDFPWSLGSARGSWIALAYQDLVSSRDGENWLHHFSPPNQILARGALFHGRYFVVGSNGAILSSDPLGPELSVAVSGQVASLTLSGDAGTTARLQSSSNLVEWSELARVPVGTNGTTGYLDRNIPAAGSRRFYRIVR
jgi:hypothetical protein